MKSVARFSLEQKIFFNLAFVLLMVAGFFAMFALPIERFPDINMGAVNIITDYPSASPVDVETLVTRKLEESISTIENIEAIDSTSQAQHSLIRLKLKDGSDLDYLYDEIRFKVLNAKSQFPPEVNEPKIEKVTMASLMPVVIINVGGDHSNRALTLMAEQIKSEIKRLPGVKYVDLIGELNQEFHVYLDGRKLKNFAVNFEDVSNALETSNLSVTAGHVESASHEYLIKVDEKFNDRNSVLNTVIRRDRNGSFIRVKDVIDRLEYEYRKPTIITTNNGNNSIALNVIKTPGGNALDIKEGVVQVLDDLKPFIERENLTISLTQDASIKIKDGLSTLGWNFAVGLIWVTLITWYFMGNRNAGLITVGIPFSFLITILLMYVFNYSFNELTLFAFVLVSGIIADDAIVVTENIYRYVLQGKDLKTAIIEGLAEVAMPVFSSTLTTVAAFFPLLIMTGSIGDFFAQIPAVICFALAASLFECFFILPVHYQEFGPKKTKLARRLEDDNFIVSFFRVITQQLLKITLKYRVSTIFSVLILFFISIGILFVSLTGIMPLVKTQFFPNDYAVYFVDLKGPPNVSIDTMDDLTRKVTVKILEAGPGKVESARGLAGLYMNENYEMLLGNNYGLVLVTMPSMEKTTVLDPMKHLDDVRKDLKEEFEKEGYDIRIFPMKEGPPSGKALNVKILGNDSNSVKKLALELFEFLKTDPDIKDHLVELEHDYSIPKKVYKFEILHDRVKEYNLNTSDVARFAGSVLDGRYLGKFRTREEEIDLKLLIDRDVIESPEQALSLPVIERSVGPVLLGDLVRLETVEQMGELHRYQGQRSVTIKSDIKSDSDISASVLVKKLSDKYIEISDNYPGATILFDGETKNTNESLKSLVFAFVVSFMLIYIILAAQFQSYLQPVIILFSVLFAIIGIILGKFLVQSVFTVNSFIAIIGVIGIVVNDALVLIDFMNKNYRSGMSRHQAIEKAVDIRLRPIVLTTLTTMLGLLPMAIGIPDYSIVWGAMASTFVCGLGAATMLTLCVAPVLWDLIQSRQEKV